MPREYAKPILDKCSGVRNLSYLSLWPHIKGPGPWSLPCAPALESLSTSADAFQGLAESGVVFPRLTHLSVDKIYPDFILPSLEWLPALKELYLCDHDDWEEALKTVASTAPGLRRLTLNVHTDYTIAIGQWVERNPSSIEVRVGDVGDADGDAVKEWRSRFMDFVLG
ncbi:hypothetical protein C0993_007228 [Termitomyces sp. T159_Od127]|nr:hypothetical protein C0993_007228 [Termitomyces sp. T159_Od127]